MEGMVEDVSVLGTIGRKFGVQKSSPSTPGGRQSLDVRVESSGTQENNVLHTQMDSRLD